MHTEASLSRELRQAVFWFVVFIAALFLLWLFQGVLAPFLMGIVLAYLLNPIVNKLETFKLPRWAAVMSILLAFFLGVVAVLALGIPLAIKEISHMAESLPQFFDAFQIWFAGMTEKFGPLLGNFDQQAVITHLREQASELLGVGKNVLHGLWAGGSAVIGVVISLVLIPIVAFYMMLDWPVFTAKVDELMPRTKAPIIRQILMDIDRTIAGFIRGQLIVCLALGLMYGLGLAVIGLDFGFVVGLASGLLSIIPYVGSTIGLVSGISMAWFQTGDMAMVGAAFALFAVGQFIEGNILAPKFVGENVGLHPIWIIFALMAGGSLLGFVGMLVAVPVAAIIGVLVRYATAEYKKSLYYK